LNLLEELKNIIESDPMCKEINVVEQRFFSHMQFSFKIRAKFVRDYNFQARIYYNRGHVDYAYQLFTNIPLLRWDNKEEFRNMKSFPHHYHDDHACVYESPLTGDVFKDIKIVLLKIADYLLTKP